MSARGSISRLSRHASPDCGLPELQCECHEPAARYIYYTENYERLCVMRCNLPEGCSLSIPEDLLNYYAKDTVNYCTSASNNSLQESLDSSVYLLNEKEQQFLQMEIKTESLCSELFAYREKHYHDTSLGKRHVKEKCKYKKYYRFFLVLCVAWILIPTV